MSRYQLSRLAAVGLLMPNNSRQLAYRRPEPVCYAPGDGAKEDKDEAEEDGFLDTVIIPSNALPSSKDSDRNSTDAFITRVKEQLATPESVATNGKDSFSSTIPR